MLLVFFINYKGEVSTLKQNCWEFKKCGREEDGINVAELGVCPASVETRLNGEHGGKNAGRTCWAIAGTFCGDRVQGTFAEKQGTCLSCDFYKLVREEERGVFQLSKELTDKLAA